MKKQTKDLLKILLVGLLIVILIPMLFYGDGEQETPGDSASIESVEESTEKESSSLEESASSEESSSTSDCSAPLGGRIEDVELDKNNLYF